MLAGLFEGAGAGTGCQSGSIKNYPISDLSQFTQTNMTSVLVDLEIEI
jgi:hypothetical protein